MTVNDGFVETLLGASRESYGPEYSSHLFGQYKLYVEMADRISERRHAANTYFITVNTIIVAVLGLLFGKTADLPSVGFLSFAGIAGMVLSYAWYRLIVSYRQINTGKFKVIHAIEARLPVRPYGAEWTAVGSGEDPRLYRPFTTIETWVPLVFFLVYFALFAVPLVKAVAFP